MSSERQQQSKKNTRHVPLTIKVSTPKQQTAKKVEAKKQVNGKVRKKRVRLSKKQNDILDAAFEQNPYPNAKEKEALAKKVGLTSKQIQYRWQNQRTKRKMTRRTFISAEAPPSADPIRSSSQSEEPESQEYPASQEKYLKTKTQTLTSSVGSEHSSQNECSEDETNHHENENESENENENDEEKESIDECEESENENEEKNENRQEIPTKPPKYMELDDRFVREYEQIDAFSDIDANQHEYEMDTD